MNTPIKIIIADDHELFVNGLRLLLKNQTHLTISDVAQDGKELLQIIEKTKPDLVLLDLNMPRLNGIDTARFIKQLYSDVRIIILSTYDQERIIEKAKQLGVDGYLLKNSSEEELLRAIDTVMHGGNHYPGSTGSEITDFDKDSKFIKHLNLTRRETEIISLIRAGLSNQDIANKLFLSIYTIETHRKNIMQKLNLKTPAALMKYIIENNLT
jgi:DNA-binding NarL/FixJ family response regulator